MLKKKLILFSSLFFCFFSAGNLQAAYQHYSKLWFAMYTEQKFCEEKPWLWSFNGHFRLIKQERPLEVAFIEPLLGHQFNDVSVWLGFRFIKVFFIQPTFNETRIVQQLIYRSKECGINWALRSRLEESYRSNQKQVSLRTRQRLAMEFKYLSFCNITPFVYNEAFLMLNKTKYTPHQFFSENRLFLGVNYYFQKNSWLEVGYIMQFIAKNPLFDFNQLNHILSFNYNFR